MSSLGNKEIMAKNIRYYMEKNKLNAKELSINLNFKYSTVLDWINAKTYPRIDKIEIMANYFNIEKSDLVEDKSKAKTQQKTQGLKIPVLGTVAAGIPISAVEDILDYEEVPQSWENQGEFFGLRIKGDSMETDINDGDTVIVRQQSTANNGDVVIALVNGDDATCKKFEKLDNGIMLISNNSKYSPMYFSNEDVLTKPVVIIGKVVELRRKF